MRQLPRFSKLTVISLALALAGCRFEAGQTASIPTATPAPTCQVDSNLIATNIRDGISILGVTGSYAGAYAESLFASNMRRSIGTAQITWAQDRAATANYPVSLTGYTAVPSFNIDHDSRFQNTYPASAVGVDRSTWTGRTCGASGSIAARIANCETEFGADATWSAQTNGSSGESDWKLVTRTGDEAAATPPYKRGREVWQDQRTKLLWSSLVSLGLNWCKAAGKNNIAGNPAAESDTTYCNFSPLQAISGPAISACYEDGGVHFTDADADIDPAGKGGLGLASTPVVHWRLPTRNDYYQAEIDGIRFVLPDTLASGNLEWTSMISVNSFSEAYGYDMGRGGSIKDYRNNGYGTRCVGR